MNKKSRIQAANGLLPMRKSTRSLFISHFPRQSLDPRYPIDTVMAAKFFGVTTRTINNWWSTGCPDWVDNYVDLYLRSIPDNEDWDGFYFGRDGRLYTPYKNFSFSADDILWVWYERNELSYLRVDTEKLTQELSAFKNDEETDAIKEEINMIISSLQKLKKSPILTLKGQFSKPVARDYIPDSFKTKKYKKGHKK